MIAFLIIFFLFGLAVGSFLNVVVYRLNRNGSPFKGRSFCPKCKKKILWHDNLPLLSFALLRGQCRFCHSPISWQYPLVELATAIITCMIYQVWIITGVGDFILFFYYLIITYSLIAIFVSDLRYTTIPDQVVWLGMVVSGAAMILGIAGVSLLSGLLSGLGGTGFFLFLLLVTRGKGMGWGDVKLAGLMGLVLGYPSILIALFFAFLTGAILGVILILLRKKHFGEHLPFGPFLVAGTMIALFWGEIIWRQISAALL